MTGPLAVLAIVAAVLAADVLVGWWVGRGLRRMRLDEERAHETRARFLGGRR